MPYSDAVVVIPASYLSFINGFSTDMQYARVFIDDISYQLAPRIISSEEIERRIEPVYKALHIPKGQLKAFTGIEQRRWWNEGFRYSCLLYTSDAADE